MGMFDYVDYECVCPVCKSKVSGFQSKDGDCMMETLNPLSLHSFYTSCEQCGCWIQFNSKPTNNYVRTVIGKESGKEKVLTEHTKEVHIGAKIAGIK